MLYSSEKMEITQKEIETINEKLWQEELSHIRNCPDCNVKPGEQHINMCDVARCTQCGGQFIQGCKCENTKRDIWTGIWPGIKECYEQKLICYDDYCGLWMHDLTSLAIKRHFEKH